MGDREARCWEPGGSPHPPSPGHSGAVGSRARGLRSRRDSAHGLLCGLPVPRLTSSCSLSLSPASRRSLPLDFSSAPPGAVAGGCWGCTGALSLPPSSISTTTAGPLRAHPLAPPLFPDGLACFVPGAPPPSDPACDRKRPSKPGLTCPYVTAWKPGPPGLALGGRTGTTIPSLLRATGAAPESCGVWVRSLPYVGSRLRAKTLSLIVDFLTVNRAHRGTPVDGVVRQTDKTPEIRDASL